MTLPKNEAKVGPTDFRPEDDYWQVGTERYESTADLLSSDFSEGVKATYRFHTPDPNKPPPQSFGATVGTGAALGALAGSGGYIFLNGLGNALGEAAFLFTLGFGGRPETTAVSSTVAAICGAVGAAAGAGIAAYAKSQHTEPSLEEKMQGIRGTIKQEGDQTVFYINNNLDRGIDLKAYAEAKDLPEAVQAEPLGRAGWAKSMALKGASVGIPLAGLFAPGFHGMAIGNRLDRGRLGLGTVLGTVAGAAVTTAVWQGATPYGLPGFVGGIAAAGLLGAGAGAVLGPKLDSLAERTVPGQSEQWWDRN